ncbi:ABC transporter permease [Marinicella sp. W31]|uniref:ABC transporter permease n=1 Tax=Marinicella sp. W31 TaxID=3023713 RepID=UPI003757C54B
MHSNIKSWQQVLLMSRRLGVKSLLQPANLMLALCLFISAMAASTLGFFSLNVSHTLNRDVAQFLGADLVVRSRNDLGNQWWQELTEQNPVKTVAITHGAIGPAGYHSIALKSISDDYPRQGELKLSANNRDYTAQGQSLHPNTAWLDRRALSVLGAQLGDRIQIGEAFFTVAAEIRLEPDRLTQLQHTLPRIMIHESALALTGIRIHQGRAEYRYLFNGTEEELLQLKNQLPVQLQKPHQILTPDSGQHPFSRLIKRAEKMLGMVSVLVLLLCGSAAAMLAMDTMRRYVYPSAVLRCMGVNRKNVSRALFLQLLCLTILSSFLGAYGGWLIQPLLADVLAPHLVFAEMVFHIKVPLLALVMTLIMLIAFVYPPLKQLEQQAPAHILRGQLNTGSHWGLTTLTATLSVLGLLWYYSDNPRLTLYLATGVLLVVIIALAFGWLLNKLTGLSYHLTRGSLRIVLRAIGRTPSKHLATMSTLGIAVMAFSMTAVLRNNFIDTYQVQHIEFDGNYIFNSLPQEQHQHFENMLKKEGAQPRGTYPTVDAMLVSINGIAIDSALKHESDSREETRSPVRLSWSEKLPDNNTLIEGQWPQPGAGEVSVEAEVMTDLGLNIGDVLGFSVGEQLLTTTITSSRQYKSGGSRFMFWFMFTPDTLERFDHTTMGGFSYHANSTQLLSRISEAFPQARIVSLEQQMSRMRDIMNAMTTIMNSILVLLLSAAFTVLIASAFVHQQKGQNKWLLLQAIGVRKIRLRFMILLEYMIIGSIACVVGIMAAEIIADTLFSAVFAMSFDGDSTLYGLMLLITAVVFAMFGWLLSRLSLKQPIQILQQS